MKYGVDGGSKRRRIVDKSPPSAAAAATTSSPFIEIWPTISKAALLPSTTGSVSASASVSEASEDESVFDHDLLDCSICIERLQSPIFQCRNGHVACTSCCKLTKNICPSCQHPTGSIRCLVLEKLIESLKEKCKNSDSGCPATLKYSERRAHEKFCPYGSVSCPFQKCDFRDLPYSLFQDHVRLKHTMHCISTDAPSDALNKIFLKRGDRFTILFSGHLCFVLHRNPVVKGSYDHSFGDMCYISVLKVLSQQYAGDIPYKMKLKTMFNEGDQPSSTFSMKSVCSVTDDDPEDFLGDGYVVVDQNMCIEIDIKFFSHGHKPSDIF